ncbi:two-component system response regulator BtsR [Geopsychrobacter electrodiphilus]|uniref:two-component system response regulator BtsR n=1 Tax=Geopsychrobacter electrodiphilus TaxID=225196 RepID=UPI0003746861|nr:two-component system response regulator BtsR [Geopsychrobacter electrodiphilus]
MIRTLIIDDEQLAREELAILLEHSGKFDLIGSCANAFEALKLIGRERPELIFLDIEMPVLDGFEMLGMIDTEQMPHVVFVTAYDQHALRAFEEKTLDYLMKPIDPERLQKTIAKVLNNITRGVTPSYPAASLQRIPCQVCNRVKLIPPSEIHYVVSDLSGVHVLTADESFYTELTLRVLEQRTLLVRCQKQYLVNPNEIDEIIMLDNGQAEIKLRQAQKIPVSRRYLRLLKEQLDL